MGAGGWGKEAYVADWVKLIYTKKPYEIQLGSKLIKIFLKSLNNGIPIWQLIPFPQDRLLSEKHSAR